MEVSTGSFQAAALDVGVKAAKGVKHTVDRTVVEPAKETGASVREGLKEVPGQVNAALAEGPAGNLNDMSFVLNGNVSGREKTADFELSYQHQHGGSQKGETAEASSQRSGGKAETGSSQKSAQTEGKTEKAEPETEKAGTDASSEQVYNAEEMDEIRKEDAVARQAKEKARQASIMAQKAAETAVDGPEL